MYSGHAQFQLNMWMVANTNVDKMQPTKSDILSNIAVLYIMTRGKELDRWVATLVMNREESSNKFQS